MDHNTPINELKELVQKFCEDRDWTQFHGAKDLAIGISTESAELLQILRFKSERQIEEMLKNEAKKKEISGEAVDVLFFLLRFAQKYDIDLSEELIAKMKISGEKYPINKVKGSNKRYTEY